MSKETTPQLPDLNQEIRKRLREDKGLSIRKAARQIQVALPTLVASLTRNTYSKTLLERTCSLVNLPTDINALNEQWEFSVARSYGHPLIGNRKFRAFFEEAEQIGRLDIDYISESEKILNEMGEGDVLANVTSEERPIHWEGAGKPQVTNLLQGAAQRGAGFLYIRPSNAALASTYTVGGRMGVSEETITENFKWFAYNLFNRDGKKSEDINVAMILTDNSNLFSHGESLTYHRYTDFDGSRKALTTTCAPLSRGRKKMAGAFLMLDDETTSSLGRGLITLMNRAICDKELSEYCGTAVYRDSQNSNGSQEAIPFRERSRNLFDMFFK